MPKVYNQHIIYLLNKKPAAPPQHQNKPFISQPSMPAKATAGFHLLFIICF